MSDWQPIETAPRDGTEVLASDYDSIEIVSYAQTLYGPSGAWWTRDDDQFFPAWWMPLPKQPEAQP